MAEPVGLVALELRPFGTDELLAYERGEPQRYLAAVAQRLHGSAVEHLALDGAALDDASLFGLELVEPRCEQRLQRGRHDDLAAALVRHRDHLGDEDRIPAARLTNPAPP